jgi:2-(1,2-epoxy-1,2-dihydrophenyl)acetyl-CoA isomerase
VIVAGEGSFYWAAHVLHGGSNDGCLSYFLPRVVGHRKALEMALFAERIKASEAKEIGLVNYVVPDEALEEETAKLVATVVQWTHRSLRADQEAVPCLLAELPSRAGDARRRALWQLRHAVTRCA